MTEIPSPPEPTEPTEYDQNYANGQEAFALYTQGIWPDAKKVYDKLAHAPAGTQTGWREGWEAAERAAMPAAPPITEVDAQRMALGLATYLRVVLPPADIGWLPLGAVPFGLIPRGAQCHEIGVSGTLVRLPPRVESDGTAINGMLISSDGLTSHYTWIDPWQLVLPAPGVTPLSAVEDDRHAIPQWQPGA